MAENTIIPHSFCVRVSVMMNLLWVKRAALIVHEFWITFLYIYEKAAMFG